MVMVVLVRRVRVRVSVLLTHEYGLPTRDGQVDASGHREAPAPIMCV